MTRAELRRKKRGDDKPTKIYNLTLEQIKSMKEETAKDAMQTAFVLMMGLPLITLRDKFDFGKIRLERFMDDLLRQYESFDQGYITIEDLWRTIEEETGVKFQKIKDKGLW